jgi:hypothetical protein
MSKLEQLEKWIEDNCYYTDYGDKTMDVGLLLKKITELKALEWEWISVDERLPEKDGKSNIWCLTYEVSREIKCRPYNEYHQCWDTEDGDDFYTAPKGGKVIYWQSLPNPPKQN